MAKKASDHIRYFQNPNGPTISTVNRPMIESDGLFFKDIDGTGKVSPVNDWRLSPEARAAAYVKELTVDEKIAQLFISDWRMGPKYPSARLRGDEVLAVNSDGVCISPNDVPGFDKDLYMPDSLKDENGKAYAYRDANGNYYELNFGLSY